MPPFDLDEHTAAHVAELFRAFSDSSRIRILALINGQELNVNQLAARVGVSESAVSHHLRGLRLMKIVIARRSGKEVFYTIQDPHISELLTQGVRHITE